MRLGQTLVLAALLLGTTAVFAQPNHRPSPVLRAFVDGAVTVSYAGMRGVSGDWIALARPGSAPTEYVTYQYPASVRGELTFPDPGPGDYVVRAYFGSSSYVVRAESAPFHVADRCHGDTGRPAVTASADGTSVVVRFQHLCGTTSDWIALAPAGAPPSTYQAWQYTNGANEGIVTLPNVAAGQWVARVFTNWATTHSYDVRAESAPFWIAPPGCVCGEPAAEIVTSTGR